MRKYLTGILIGSLLALAGCQKNEVPAKEVESKVVTVTASIKGAEETRTQFTPGTDENGNPYIKVNWKESGEEFMVYPGNTAPGYKFTQVSGNQFKGELHTDGAGYMAYYKSTLSNNVMTYDISEQDGTLNDEYSVMMAACMTEPVFFEFIHQTLILKPTFKINGGVVDHTQISKIVMGNVRYPDSDNASSTTITVSPDELEDIYIFVPDDSAAPYYAAGHKFTFDVTINGITYNTSLTVPKALDAGKYYTATINLTESSCYLPSGEKFRAAIVDAMNQYSKETVYSIKFEVGCPSPGVADVMIPGTAGAPAYLTQEGSTLIIHTNATENFVFNEDCSYMFAYNEISAPQMENILTIDFANCETSQVTDMSYMFHYCQSLQKITNMSFNTENVTNMSHMFVNCGRNVYTGGTVNLVSPLDLRCFNTSKVTDMSYMFSNCAVPSVNISTFNTSNVKNMAYMFNGMSGLSTLDLSSLNTGNVTDMSSMFSGCSELTALELPDNFTTANVTTMKAMFNSCKKITSLNLLKFNTENVTDMSYMFQYCHELTSLELGAFKTPKLTTMNGIFNYCTKMEGIYMPNFVSTSNLSVTDALTGLGKYLEGTVSTKIQIKDIGLINKLTDENSDSGYKHEDTRANIQQIS